MLTTYAVSVTLGRDSSVLQGSTFEMTYMLRVSCKQAMSKLHELQSHIQYVFPPSHVATSDVMCVLQSAWPQLYCLVSAVFSAVPMSKGDY